MGAKLHLFGFLIIICTGNSVGPDHALHYVVSNPGRHYYHGVFFILYLLLMEFLFSCWKDGSFLAGNTVDADNALHFVASDLGLYCFIGNLNWTCFDCFLVGNSVH